MDRTKFSSTIQQPAWITDNFGHYNLSTSVSSNTSGDFEIDLSFPVRDHDWNNLAGSITFSDAENRTNIHSLKATPTQRIQPRKDADEQWDKVKEIIHEQYIVENHKLIDVMLHMEQEHSFIAR